MPAEQSGDSSDSERDLTEASVPSEQIGGVALSNDPTQRTVLKGSDNLPDSEIPRLEELNKDTTHPRHPDNLGLAQDMANEEDEVNYDHPSTKIFRANAYDEGTAETPDYGRDYAARLRGDIREAKDAGVDGTMKSGHYIGAGTKRESWVETTTSIPALEYEASKIDKKASERGEWVRFLHEHPVPQDYKDRYPHISFTAKGLANLEALTEYRGYEVKKIQNKIKAFDKPKWGQFELGDILTPYFEEYDDDEGYNEDEGDDEDENRAANHVDTELAKLLNKGSTTIDDLKELFKSRAIKELEGLTHDIEEGRQILEEVRSGRTVAENHTKPEETDGKENDSEKMPHVSETFKNAHPEFKFVYKPGGLKSLRYQVKLQGGQLKNKEEELERIDKSDWDSESLEDLKGYIRADIDEELHYRHMDWESEEIGPPPDYDEEEKETIAVLEKPGVTKNDIKARLRELKAQEVERQRAIYDRAHRILQDILSGEAANEDYQEKEGPNTELDEYAIKFFNIFNH